MSKIKKYYVISKVLILLFLGLLIIGIIYKKASKIVPNENALSLTTSQGPIVKIRDISIPVQIANNDKDRTQGLSNRNSLAQNEGMLFTFPENSRPFFWMKDMLFSIDIIWINEGKIVHIDQDVPKPEPNTPDYKLPLYSPPTKINYVLEVNAGFTQKYGIKTSDIVEIKL